MLSQLMVNTEVKVVSVLKQPIAIFDQSGKLPPYQTHTFIPGSQEHCLFEDQQQIDIIVNK